MGFIADLTSSKRASFPGDGEGRDLWRAAFGQPTNKEEAHARAPKERSVAGGSWARSATGDAGLKRLLEAMRSKAPGGWSDDRWEQTKHFVGIIYVAVHRASEHLSQAEFQVLLRDDSHPDGGVPVPKSHDAYQLNKRLDNPNREDSFGDLMYRWNQQMDLTGKCLTWMVPNVFGVPHEFYSIPTALAVPQPSLPPDFPDGAYRIQPVYPYGPFSSYPTPNSAVGALIPGEWVIEAKYPHPFLRYDGFSPLTALRLEMDEFEMIGRSRHSSMRRGVKPSAVLNFEGTDGMQPLPREEVDRIHAEWENEFGGPDNAGRMVVGSPGGKVEPWMDNASEMEYSQSWEQLADFILGGGFGIAKQVAGMLNETNYATLFATLKQVHLITLNPKCRRFGHMLTRHVGPFFGDDVLIKVKCPKIDDHEVLFQKLDRLSAAKALTKNELRKAVEFPVTQEEWGEDMAGDPSPKEQEQMQADQQAAAMPGMGGAPAPEGMEGEAAAPGSEPLGQEPEVEESRPDLEMLAEGSLGPRKGLPYGLLNGRAKRLTPTTPTVPIKSFFDMVQEVCSNGHS